MARMIINAWKVLLPRPAALWSLLLVYCLCGFPSALALDAESADDVRAFILLRLAGQIYWSPASDLSEPDVSYRLCIYRDPRFFQQVRHLLQDRELQGKAVQLVAVEELPDLESCHVAYVGDVSREDIARILSLGLLSRTVFVASSEFSAEVGLHIRLYLGASDTFDIEINRAAFALGGNEPSASFIKLAGKVYDHEPSRGSLQ